MSSTPSTEPLPSHEFKERKRNPRKGGRKPKRRSSVGDHSWPPAPKKEADQLSVSLHDPRKSKQQLENLVSPTTPRRARTSAKLKMLWPALDPLQVLKQPESSDTTAMSPAARRLSSQSPASRRRVKRVSESVLHELGKPFLSASGKRRTVKGVPAWPPPNPNLKQESEMDFVESGITENRKSMFLGQRKAASARALTTPSTSNDEWANSPRKQPSPASKEALSDNLDFESLFLNPEVDEDDTDMNHYSGIFIVDETGRKQISSWENWTEEQEKTEIAGNSPLHTPTREAMPLGTKADVKAIPGVPDLVLSPHDKNSTPNTSASDRQKVQIPIEGMASPAINTDVNDSEIGGSAIEEPKIGIPPIDCSPEVGEEVSKPDDGPQAGESQEGAMAATTEASREDATQEGTVVTITEAPTQIQEDAPPAENDGVSRPLSPQFEDSDDESFWSSEDEFGEESVEDTDDDASTDPADSDEEESGQLRFVGPEQTTKTRGVGRKRHHTEYRIRWDGPTTLDLSVYYPLVSIPEIEDLPEHDDRFEKSKADGGITMPMRSGRSIDGDSRSLDSWFGDDHSFDSDEKSQKSLSSSVHSRPSIHLRPVEEDEEEKDDSKWKLKRVWDVEEMDEKEKEHTVQRAQVMPSVKELCGIPENVDLKDGNNGTPWVIQRVNFIDDEEIDCEDSEAFTSDEMMKEIETITSKKDDKRRKGKKKRKQSEKGKSKEKDQTKEKKAKNTKKKKKKNKKKRASDADEKITTTAKDQKNNKKAQKKKGKRKSKKIDEKKGEVISASESESELSFQETPKPLPIFTLSSGQKLPPTKKKRKARRTNYQLRYDGPSFLQVSELFSIPEEDNRFVETAVDKSMVRLPERRGSDHMRVSMESEDHDELPIRPSRTISNDSLSDPQPTHKDELQKSNHGGMDPRAVKRPQLLMTATKGQDPEKMQWVIRRVWDIEEYDEKEDDHSVRGQELSSKVRELFGVPNDVDLEHLTSESRFTDASSKSDSAPFMMRRIHDFDGEIDEVEVGIEFGADDLQKAIDHCNAEAEDTVMWWDMVPDAEPRKIPAFKFLIKQVKQPWFTHNVEDETKPKRVNALPWQIKATPKIVEERTDIKMWWD